MVITASCSMLLPKCMGEMNTCHVTRAGAIFSFRESKLPTPSRPICHVLVHILSLIDSRKQDSLISSCRTAEHFQGSVLQKGQNRTGALLALMHRWRSVQVELLMHAPFFVGQRADLGKWMYQRCRGNIKLRSVRKNAPSGHKSGMGQNFTPLCSSAGLFTLT